MATTGEDIDRLFDYHIHIKSRTLFISSDINDEAAQYFIKGMHVLNKSNKQRINIVLNSPGGDWYSGLAIYDAILSSNCPTIIEVYGHAMSMAALILESGDIRIAHKNTTIMLHDGQHSFDGKPRDLEAWAKHSTNQRNLLYNILSKRSGKSVRYWQDRCTHDCILNAEEAKNVGLIDKII